MPKQGIVSSVKDGAATWERIKIVGALVLLVPIAGFLAYGFFYGTGSVHVFAPKDMSVNVALDGKQVVVVKPGAHEQVSVEQGSHEVTLAPSNGAPKRFKVDVGNGMVDRVLPLDGQCFALFDVTKRFYGNKRIVDAIAKDVEVLEKHADGSAFDKPATEYHSTEELPENLGEGKRAKVFQQVACPLLKGPDEKLVAGTLDGSGREGPRAR